MESFRRLTRTYDFIIIEGAGSPAEINLRENDLVNMGLARAIESNVIIIGDIDKGGVFASLVGTMELLDEYERGLVRGFIINKFRGDIDLLKPGLEFLEARAQRPVVGVIPYIRDLLIQEEDGVSMHMESCKKAGAELHIAVIDLPHISNFTDFDPLAQEPDVNLEYCRPGRGLDGFDLVILPGTKNTIDDMIYLKENGRMADEIRAYYKAGGTVAGICGGYQMLGMTIHDPYKIETVQVRAEGIGIFHIDTTIESEKVTSKVTVKPSRHFPINDLMTGYEIHMGNTRYRGRVEHFAKLIRDNADEIVDGVISADGLSFGTYVHGIFENDRFRRLYLDMLRKKKGLDPLGVDKARCGFLRMKEDNYNRLADIVRGSLDMDMLKRFLNEAIV